MPTGLVINSIGVRNTKINEIQKINCHHNSNTINFYQKFDIKTIMIWYKSVLNKLK